MILADETATTGIGAALARSLPDVTRRSLLVGLSGELGSGKTTLARGLLRELGVTGTIKSPTYTLVEPYETPRGSVHHLDLYRLGAGARELEALGYRDIRALPGLIVVEWPERASSGLGTLDLKVTLEHRTSGRGVRIEALTPAGAEWLGALSSAAVR